MNQFKAAIFDMDGLLIDTEVLAVQTFNDSCAHFGLGEHNALIISCIGTNSTLSKEIIKTGLPQGTDIDQFHEYWQALYKRLITDQPIPVKPGAKALLAHLHSINMPIAMATSTKTEMAKRKLASVGLIQYFDIIIGGDQVENSKPNPEGYLKAAALLAVDPTDCVVFEDSANGVKAGVAANMSVVQIPDLVSPTEELLALGHTVLGSLEEVVKYFSSK